MPSWIDNLRSTVAKAFRLGPVLVQPFETSYGKDTETFNPTAYGEYLATSVSVYACATLRAENLAGVPLRLYKGTDDDRQVVDRGPLFDLLGKVNPFWSLPFLLEMTELAMCLWGEAFWVLERDGRGKPTEIWWASPDKMTPRPHATEYLAGFTFEHEGQRIDFAPDEVIWFRYPNPMDEYEGLSPIAAARMSIDLGQAGLTSNKRLFDQGMQLGGIISPADKETTWPKESVQQLEKMLSSRFKGADKAHKWAVLGHAMNVQAMGVSPKDAEFIGQMRWSLSDVCRVYKVSPVLVQDLEHSTYSNFDAALKSLWTITLVPEGRRIAAALTEQLLPMFPGEADSIEFDFSEVDVLQEGEDSKWTREQGQIQANAITINEWRTGRGLDPVPWGDGPAPTPDPMPQPQAQDDGSPAAAAQRALQLLKGLEPATTKAIALGSQEHLSVWKRFDRRATRHEAAFKALVVELFERQRDAILADAQKGLTAKAIDPSQPFDPDEWRELFVAASLRRFEQIVQDSGDGVYDDLELGISWDVNRPEVQSFIKGRAQRFAEQVNATTYQQLQDTLAEATQAGETIDQIASRVEQVMGDRIASSSEVIARTETIGALNGGALEAARASGVVDRKQWLAALDGRQRDSHDDAHQRYQAEGIPLDADFEVGGGAGPAPGQIGLPEEDIQCRCTLTWVVEGDQ